MNSSRPKKPSGGAISQMYKIFLYVVVVIAFASLSFLALNRQSRDKTDRMRRLVVRLQELSDPKAREKSLSVPSKAKTEETEEKSVEGKKESQAAKKKEKGAKEYIDADNNLEKSTTSRETVYVESMPGHLDLKEGLPTEGLAIEGAYLGNALEINFLLDDRQLIALHLSIRPKGRDPAQTEVSLVTNTFDGRSWGMEQHVLLSDWKANEPFKLTVRADERSFIIGSNGRDIISSCYYRLGGNTWDGKAVKSVSATGAVKGFRISRGVTPPAKWLPAPTGTPSSKFLLLIAVMSSPDHAAKRDFQRRTWASKKNLALYDTFGRVKVLYFIGTKGLESNQIRQLETEHEQHDDIVHLNLKDEYLGLTKKVLETMKHSYREDMIYSEIGAPKFFLKIDDDVYIRVGNVVEMIREKAANSDLFWAGHFTHKGQPIRDEYSKNFLPRSELGENESSTN